MLNTIEEFVANLVGSNFTGTNAAEASSSVPSDGSGAASGNVDHAGEDDTGEKEKKQNDAQQGQDTDLVPEVEGDGDNDGASSDYAEVNAKDPEGDNLVAEKEYPQQSDDTSNEKRSVIDQEEAEDVQNGEGNNPEEQTVRSDSATGIDVQKSEVPASNPSQDADTNGSKHGLLSGMTFYLRSDSTSQGPPSESNQLSYAIKTHGGQLLDKLPENPEEGVFVVAPYNDTKLPTVTPTYIRECIKNNKLLKMENYLVPYDSFHSVIDSRLEGLGDDTSSEPKEEVGGETEPNQETRYEESPDTQPPETQMQSIDSLDTQNGDMSRGVVVADAQMQDLQHEREEQLKLLQGHMKSNMSSQNGNVVDGALVQLGPSASPPSDQQIAHEKTVYTADGAHSADKPPGQNTSSLDGRAYQQFLGDDALGANASSRNKVAFTEEEDEFILDVVRKNPTRRTTHSLFDEISHYVPNHTGNSIRHRFRVYLSKRLDFVYQVDKYGKLVRDENGGLIKTRVLPPSIKRKFTAEEDYCLAMEIKKQFYKDIYQIDPDTGSSLISANDSPQTVARRSLTMDRTNSPGSEPNFADYKVGSRKGPIAREFFKKFAGDYPSHTENAWRDRFRKFLMPYGIDAYIEYYESSTAVGKEPTPMKNMTNRPKRPGIPTPGNNGQVIKRPRMYKSEIPQAGETEGGRSPNGRNPTSSNTLSMAVAEAATLASGGETNGNQQAVSSGQTGYSIPENELLDEETMTFLSTLKTNLTSMEGSLPFEYPQEVADAIRHDFTNEESEYDSIDPETIPFPPPIATTDLFLPSFFRMSSTKEFMDKVNEVISRDYETSQAEKLVQDLCDEVGIRKVFSTTILTALSGDLMVFPRYFLNIFKYNINPPPNVPGIWTREDDEMLRGGKEEDIKVLEKKHGAGRIEMRKRFIERDIV